MDPLHFFTIFFIGFVLLACGLFFFCKLCEVHGFCCRRKPEDPLQFMIPVLPTRVEALRVNSAQFCSPSLPHVPSLLQGSPGRPSLPDSGHLSHLTTITEDEGGSRECPPVYEEPPPSYVEAVMRGAKPD